MDKSEYNRKNPEKHRAHVVVLCAFRNGSLIRQPCSVCDNPFGHAHHEDYSKPLEIVWLCRQCHTKRHQELREKLLVVNPKNRDIIVLDKKRRLMTKRFIFSWKDEAEEARFKAAADFEGVTMSEMMHRVIAQIPVIGTTSGENNKITITQLDGEVMTIEEELARR